MKCIRERVRLASENGFTLIELMITLVLTVIVLSAISVGFSAALSSEARATRTNIAQENARLVLGRLRKDIHCAFRVQGPQLYADGGYKIGLTEALDGNQSLCPGVGPGSTIQWCTERVEEGNDVRWRLFRDDETDCQPAASHFEIDYLVLANPWSLHDRSAVACDANDQGQASTVEVNLQIDVSPLAENHVSYTLKDDIALRNSRAKCVPS